MTIVNYWFIWDAFSELERHEAEAGEPLDIDSNDEECMRRAFDSYVHPWVSRLSTPGRKLFMTTLAHFLKQPHFTGSEILSNIPDLAMNRPVNDRRLFEWMWLSLFPKLNYHDVDTSNCTEDNDIMHVGVLTEGMTVN